MVPHKKKNPNPIILIYKTTIHHVIQRFCVFCNRDVYPERRYKYHSSEHCNTFLTPDQTKKDIYGYIEKRDVVVKQLRKTEEMIKKQMKSLERQNKILYKMTKTTSYLWELRKIKNIKPICDSSIINSSYSSEYDAYFFLSFLSD